MPPPGFYGGAIEQVELRAAGGEQLVVAGALKGWSSIGVDLKLHTTAREGWSLAAEDLQ